MRFSTKVNDFNKKEEESDIKFSEWGQFFILEKNGAADAGVKFFANSEF